ncbi:MAG: hypothetical protein ACE5FG_14900 [Myxococcota bacterium]
MKRSKRAGTGRWQQHWTEAEARAFLSSWRESGTLLPVYCREQGIGYERVRRWRAKLARKPARKAAPVRLRAVRIVPEVAPACEAKTTMEIELARGLRVRVERGFDADELVRLVVALERV